MGYRDVRRYWEMEDAKGEKDAAFCRARVGRTSAYLGLRTPWIHDLGRE